MSKKQKASRNIRSVINKIKWFFYDVSVSISHLFHKNGKNKKSVSAYRNYKSLIFYILVLLFPVAQFCIFYIGVNFNSVLLAFKKYTTTEGTYQWVGLDNFKAIIFEFTNSNLIKDALGNSLNVYFMGLLLVTIPATMFSFYIFKKKALSGLFRIILFLPSVLPSVILVILYKFFVEEALTGYIAELFNKQIIGLLSNPNTRFGTILFYNIWIGFGTQILLYTGSMSQISPSIIESSQIDGAGHFREYWNIVLPQIYNTLSTFIIVGVAGIFVNQANIYSFYGYDASYSIYTIGYYLFVKVMGKSSSLVDYPFAAAFGLICSCFAVPLTFAVKRLLEKYGSSEN